MRMPECPGCLALLRATLGAAAPAQRGELTTVAESDSLGAGDGLSFQQIHLVP